MTQGREAQTRNYGGHIVLGSQKIHYYLTADRNALSFKPCAFSHCKVIDGYCDSNQESNRISLSVLYHTGKVAYIWPP